MASPPLDPPVADSAPETETLTKYDRQHLVTYLRLLDAEEEHATWQEVARIVLHLDPDHDSERAYKSWKSHLERAHWLSENGYRDLMREGPAL